MVTSKDFNGMTTHELYSLNKLLVAEIRARQKEDARAKSERFKFGQEVKFTDGRGVNYVGNIIKFNSKTISVQTGLGVYKVSPSLLLETETTDYDVMKTLEGEEVSEFEAEQRRNLEPLPKSDKPKTQSESVW